MIAARKLALQLRHWGDADLGGLRIRLLIRARLGHPVALYRTRAEWLGATVRSGSVQAIDLADAAALITMLRRSARRPSRSPWRALAGPSGDLDREGCPRGNRFQDFLTASQLSR